MAQSYEDRLRRVLRHIHDNPAGDLSLDTLADVAALSRFHWHRVFHAMTGETCAEAVRRVRAHRAAIWLVETDAPVADIAARAGYDNPRSFARAFRDVFGLTPVAFRRRGSAAPAPLILKLGARDMTDDIDITDFPARRIVGIDHRGAYAGIGRAFDQLSALLTARDLWPRSRGLVAIYFDGPSAAEPDSLRSLAGIEVAPEAEMPADLRDYLLPAGPHAVLRHAGPYAGLGAAYERLYGDWLPRSGREPTDVPPFELYRNTPMDVAPDGLRTDICLPLRPGGGA